MDEPNRDALVFNPFKDKNFTLADFKKKISIKY